MAKMKPKSIGKQAQSLAKLWGHKFGHQSFSRTVGEMKNLLRGNEDKALSSYRHDQIKGCIEWLALAQEEGHLNKPVQGPGVIRFVIDEYIAGSPIEKTWLCYRKPQRFIAMLE